MNAINLRFHLLIIHPWLLFHVCVKDTLNRAQLSSFPSCCCDFQLLWHSVSLCRECSHACASPIHLLFSFSLSRGIQESQHFKCKSQKYFLIGFVTPYISFATTYYSIHNGRSISSALSQLQHFLDIQIASYFLIFALLASSF